MTESACLRILRNRCLVGIETRLDPVSRPGKSAFLGLAELFTQIAHHAQVLDRMDIGGRNQGQCPHARAAHWILGQQRRLRMGLLQILEDGERLGQHFAGIEHQGWHQHLRIEDRIVRRPLLALAQVPRGVLDHDTLEIERDTHAIRRRRTKIADELHDRLRHHPSTALAGGV